jgi:hypothetical protein
MRSPARASRVEGDVDPNARRPSSEGLHGQGLHRPVRDSRTGDNPERRPRSGGGTVKRDGGRRRQIARRRSSPRSGLGIRGFYPLQGEEGSMDGNPEQAGSIIENDRLVVHHIVRPQHGGTDETSNLVTLCRSCHGLAHAKRDRPVRPSGPLFFEAFGTYHRPRPTGGS